MLEQPIESTVLTLEKSVELANQQGTSLAWFSGLVDGEGTLTFTCDWGRGVYSPYFQVCNTEFSGLDKCKEILDFNQIGYYVRTQKLNSSWKIVWKITISNHKQVLKLLKLILPYLIIKKRQAEILVDFLEQRMKDHSRYTADQIRMIQLVKKANMRGPSETLHLPFPNKDKDKVHN